MTPKKDLEFSLLRRYINVTAPKGETATIGELHIHDGGYAGSASYFVCEDEVREGKDGVLQKEEKVDGKTAIPEGRYEVKKTYSHKFKRNMLQIMDVPYFEGVRIHSGNLPEDTRGCPLIGTGTRKNKGEFPNLVTNSRVAMTELDAICDRVFAEGRRIFITVKKHSNHIFGKVAS
jgi:hypothetical protein